MDTKGEIVFAKGGQSVEIESGPNELTTYANIVGMLLSPDEVILHFGLRKTNDPTSGIGIVKIYLTPAHAKRLATALNDGIQRIEGVFGEIIADPAKKLTPEQLQKLQNNKSGTEK